jgi:hypothetical protein
MKILIIMVHGSHGGIRDVQRTRVFGKSNRHLEYVIFLNLCDIKKVINLIIRTRK